MSFDWSTFWLIMFLGNVVSTHWFIFHKRYSGAAISILMALFFMGKYFMVTR